MSALQSILNQFDINESIFVMLGIFVGTYLLVNRIALNKLSSILVERDERIDGREAEVIRLQGELKDIQEKLKTEMNQARIKAQETFVFLKLKAVQEQRDILNTAREESAAEVGKVRTQVRASAAQALTKLESEIPGLAKLIIARVLGVAHQAPRLFGDPKNTTEA